MSGPILTSSRGSQFRPPICWPLLLPVPDADGRLNFPDLESSIRQRIEAVLRTSPGEQLMRPGFGAGLELLVHKPNTAEVRARTREAVMAAVRVFEPRVVVDRVTVAPAKICASSGSRSPIASAPPAPPVEVSAKVPVGGA